MSCSAKSGALVSHLRAADGSQYSDPIHVESATQPQRGRTNLTTRMNDTPFLRHAFVVVQHMLPCFSSTRYPGSLKPNSACIASI